MKIDVESTNEWVKHKIGDLWLPDSGTTHTILKDRKYFYDLRSIKANVNTISDPIDFIKGSRKASFILPNIIKNFIDNILFSPHSKRNLLSFNDIFRNGYDIEIAKEGNRRYIYRTSNVSGKKCILDKWPLLLSGLHYTYINMIESHMAVYRKSNDSQSFNI